jgi:hypothetical protein
MSNLAPVRWPSILALLPALPITAPGPMPLGSGTVSLLPLP